MFGFGSVRGAMPETPDLETYLHALRPRIVGRRLEQIRLATSFLLRSIAPPLEASYGLPVASLQRLGKRIVFAFEGQLFLVLHLMIAGRLRWQKPRAKIPTRSGLAAFDFDCGTLVLTEAGSRKRASLHVVAGDSELAHHDPGGIEPLTANLRSFRRVLTIESHTLKRALTDPRILSGIGNAYSDEILHRARLSPFKRTSTLEEGEMARLYRATKNVLTEWTRRLIAESGEDFPQKVTAFRPEMAVHGRFGKLCPVCSAPVQRILYAKNESNYCPGCQTEGRILADRVLSKLLKGDWPRTLEELEQLRGKVEPLADSAASSLSSTEP